MSAVSSSRSSPIPDLAYFESPTNNHPRTLRDQILIRRQFRSNGGMSTNDVRNNLDTVTSVPHPPSSHRNIQQNLLRYSENPKHYVTINSNTYALAPYTTETLVFWMVLAVLIMLVIANSILTFIIFGSIGMTTGGSMESIEVLPDILKLYGDVDLDEINKLNGIIEAFGSESMEIEAGEDGGRLELGVTEGGSDGSTPELALDKHGINITQIDELLLEDTDGTEIFTTTKPILKLPRTGINDIRLRLTRVNRLTSAINSSLEIMSSSFTRLKGSEGTRIDGKWILLSVDRDIILKPINGNITITGRNGISMYTHYLSLVLDSNVTRNHHTYPTQGKKQGQFKLCICMPQGNLFRIEIPLNNKHSPRRITCNLVITPCQED